MGVMQRIVNSRDKDLGYLVESMRIDGQPGGMTSLKPYFQTARTKPAEFRDHGEVLAVSIGGTNVKVMLASMAGGVVQVRKLIAKPNPVVMTEFDDYFADLLLGEKEFAEYLRAPGAVIGLSIAVGIKDDVPQHPTKIPCVRNLVARDREKEAPTHNLRRNLAAFFQRQGMAMPQLIFEGDCPLAHLGSVVMAGLGPDDPSFLTICGTGMASADDELFLGFGSELVLSQDDLELFPPEQTENGQLQYCVAGKGLWSFMRRAAEFRSAEPGSELTVEDVHRWFATSADSKNVGLIWESTLPEADPSARADEIRLSMSPGAWADLQRLAVAVMDKAISAFGNNTMATLIFMGNDPSGKPCTIFVEGGFAMNRHVYKRFEAEMYERCADKALFERLGCPQPIRPKIVRDVRRAVRAGDFPEEVMAELDITIIGAMCLAIAETVMSK